MKRKLALLLSAVMASSGLPLTAYAANFKDINNVPWEGAQTVINSVADKGLLSGYGDGTFRAKNNVTYCEAMQMVYNVLLKTGVAKPMDAVDAYSYMTVMDTYRVPKWAQYAVAYGLQNNILDLSMLATKFAGGNQAATREDVARLFGNALSMSYDKERDAAEAKKFGDAWNISAEALSQIDLLKRLGVISGDSYNNFNPKKNINRAEMAVMLNKTNNVLTVGVEESGTISKIMVNENKYYSFTVKMDNGGTEYVQATLGELPVYSGDTTVALDRLNEGDQVKLVRGGNGVVAIRLTKGSTAQSRYDMTGYVSGYKDDKLTFDNENTGESLDLKLESDAKIIVDGQQITRTQMKRLLEERWKEFAFAGINTTIEREKVDGSYQDVTYVQELYLTFMNECTITSEVESFDTSRVVINRIGRDKEFYSFTDTCEFYIGENKSTAAALKKMADEGTTYVKLTKDTSGKVFKIIMSEDSFEESKKDASRVYIIKDFNTKRMILKLNGEETTYTFGSTNAVENIQFYKFVYPSGSPKKGDWEELKNVTEAESFVDKEKEVDSNGDEVKDGNIYCKVVLNRSGKLQKVYLSGYGRAWITSSEEKTERKGTVASIQNDTLKFKTSSIGYKLKTKYKDGDIQIPTAKTASKKVLTRMGNDPAMVLYAEIVADDDKKVIEVEARLTAASGKLVEYDQENKIIKIETSEGEYELNTVTKPKLKGEDKDNKTFTLDDIATSKYVGEEIKLGFNSSGLVNELEMVNGPNAGNGLARVRGIATAADKGLQVEGGSKTYTWLSAKNTNLTVYGSPTKDLDKVKGMIEDKDVKVYVEALLDDEGRVDTLRVYVREAEGKLDSCDEDYVRIETSSGNIFSFELPDKLKSCNVNELNQKRLENGDADGKGYNVKLTFGNDGIVTDIASK